ncbi:MAG: P-II family nitrogen regulator [Reichenbachiella sp.]
MKLIIAIIRENQLDQVRQSLVDAGVSRITASNVSGHGRAHGTEEIYRGQKVVPNMTSNVRVEIAVNDEFVDVTVNAISTATKSNENGMLGSGKIMIMPLDDVIRIRTGEKGSEAI